MTMRGDTLISETKLTALHEGVKASYAKGLWFDATAGAQILYGPDRASWPPRREVFDHLYELVDRGLIVNRGHGWYRPRVDDAEPAGLGGR